MAVVSAAVTVNCVTSVALQPSQNLSVVARFNGLKAYPILRQRAVVSKFVVPAHRLRVSASAEPQTLTVVQKIIATQLAVDQGRVLPESKFTDLGADSLDTVEIMMALEEQFKIQLDEEGADAITTVQEVADLIENFIAKGAKA